MTEDHFSQRKFQTQNSSLNQLHDPRTRNEVKSEVFNIDGRTVRLGRYGKSGRICVYDLKWPHEKPNKFAAALEMTLEDINMGGKLDGYF